MASVRLVCEVSCPARGDCLGTLGMRADTGQALGTVMRIVIRGQPCQTVGNRNILFPVVRTHLLLLGLAPDVGERGDCTTVSVVIYSSHNVSAEVNESYDVDNQCSIWCCSDSKSANTLQMALA